MPQSANDIDDFDEELKSKSEIKREMLELQDFAQKLMTMSKHERSRLPLTPDLLDAMVVADKIRNKHEAFRRHIRYVAKVLVETDLAPIHQALDVMANKHQQESAKHTRIEKLRDKVISEGTPAIEELLAKYENLERQKLRQLVRQANKEVSSEKTGKHFKELFTYLKIHCV